MKKALIAGAASVALAAMPVVGVFAANTAYPSITDEITLTVSKTCEMQADENLETTVTTPSTSKGTKVLLGTASGSVAGSEYAEVNGTVMTITCNSQSGWTLAATATSLAADGTDQTIPFGAYSASGSIWSAKIAVSGADYTAGNAEIVNNFGDYTATTASSTTILQATGNSGAKKAVNGITVTPSYKAKTASNQAAGTYVGTMKYVFTDLGA